MKKNGIKLLIFDWDGTLVDSAGTIVAAMQAAINHLQLPSRSDAQIRNIIGLGLLEAAQSLYPEMGSDCHTQIGNCYRSQYARRAHEPSLFMQVPETLNSLQLHGYSLAVATGKSRKGLDNSLRHTGLHGFFHATRCADETCSKPHPRMLLEILEELDTLPEHAVMVGDSSYDMQMALNACVSPIAVSYGVHDSVHLQQYRPLVCLDKITDLREWLLLPH